jgi:hypothetical protein
MAAALIVTADVLATEWIFKDGRQLTVEDMAEFMKSRRPCPLRREVTPILCDWVSQNANRLRGSAENGDV